MSLSNKVSMRCYKLLVNNEECFQHATSIGDALRKVSDLRLEETDVVTVRLADGE